MRKRKKIIIALICLISGAILSGICIETLRRFSLIGREAIWSIGIYMGDSATHFASSAMINNPVLTAEDVSDIDAAFVADPFMVQAKHKWFMFFEVLNNKTKQGDIGLAESTDGIRWNYKQIVLDEPFHLSYPYVFKWNNEYYMIPESSEVNSIRLYKSIDFPVKWSFVATLLKGNRFVDPSILRTDNKWWMFTCPKSKSDTLLLYSADELLGPWTEHPQSPIVKGNANIARPGGRVIMFNKRIIRYTQDCYPVYGSLLRAFEITKLTPENYKEKIVNGNPILKGSGSGWNASVMHHIDPHQISDDKWIACVDGAQKKIIFFGFSF